MYVCMYVVFAMNSSILDIRVQKKYVGVEAVVPKDMRGGNDPEGVT